MRNLLILVLLSALIAPLSAAIGEHQGSDYMVRAMVSLWHADMDGDFNYADSGATFPDDVSASDLNLDAAESSLRYEIGINLPLIFDVMIGGYSFGREGSEVLDKSITYGGTDYTVGTNVDSELSVDDIYAEMAFRLSLLNASVTAGLAIHKQSVLASVDALGIEEKVDEDIYFPTLAVRGFVNLPHNITVEGRLHYLEVEISDFKASYTELHALVSWRPLHHIGIFAGYQIAAMDLDIDDVSGIDNVKIGYDLSGPFIGLLAQF